MRYFMHYKNKPYRFVGSAKHSETLEDMVIYECLYDNPMGKIWVRPKTMFFESVTVNGKSIPRFREVEILLESTTAVSGSHFKNLEPLISECIGKCDQKWFQSKFEKHSQFHLASARLENKLIGFKLGYAEDNQCFYSWLGAVLPEYRGLGVATALMKSQHDWCRESGFTKVRIKTSNRYKEMLLLNLKSGFEVAGVHLSGKQESEIILELNLEN